MVVLGSGWRGSGACGTTAKLCFIGGSCGREIAPVLVGDDVACACGVAFGIRVKADDGAVDRAPPAGILPVLGPVVLDGAAGLADVLEVGPAEILVLLDVEPEVEDVLCALSLEEETRWGQRRSGERDGDGLEHEEVDGRAGPAGENLGERRETVLAAGGPLVLFVHPGGESGMATTLHKQPSHVLLQGPSARPQGTPLLLLPVWPRLGGHPVRISRAPFCCRSQAPASLSWRATTPSNSTTQTSPSSSERPTEPPPASLLVLVSPFLLLIVIYLLTRRRTRRRAACRAREPLVQRRRD